ncbi:MAG: HAD family hydrolase [Fimbriimonadaceae bacterium]|nr:HAD family hydrolase [Fimbriimonadaceae bacterium]
MMDPDLGGVRAIYFDLDDTLCGYWDAAKTGLWKTFEYNPVAGRSTQEMLKVWGEEFKKFGAEIGSDHWYPLYCESGEHTRRELMRRVLARVGIDDPDHGLRLSDTYYVERHAALTLFPEAVEVLETLVGLHPLGLITNGPTDIQRQEIEKLQIGRFFQHIFIEGEQRMGKPNPEVMSRAQEAVGVPAEQILMVGNSFRHDVIPAQAAGWKTAWVRRPSDVPPSSKTGLPEEMPEDATPPDLTMTDLRELWSALGMERSARAD